MEAKGEKVMAEKLSQDKIKEVKSMYMCGYTTSQIAKKFKKHHSTIHRILGNLDERPEVILDFREDLIKVQELISSLEFAKTVLEKTIKEIMKLNKK